MKLHLVTLAVAAAVALSGCEPEQPPRPASPATPDYIGDWRLIEGRGPDGDIAIMGRYPVTMALDRRGFNGVAACNDYGARLTVEGTSFEARGLAANQMGCRPDVQRAEQRYFAALIDIESIERSGDRLVLTGPRSELIFEPVTPAPVADLVDREWTLVAPRADAKGSVRATFEMRSDHSFVATAGCHDLTGTWGRHGAAITLPEISLRESRCEGKERHEPTTGILTDGFVPTLRADGHLIVESRDGRPIRYVFVEAMAGANE